MKEKLSVASRPLAEQGLVLVMANCMCQLAWAWGAPTLGQTLLWAVGGGVYNESDTRASRLRPAARSPSCGWASSNQAKARTEQKAQPLPGVRGSSSCPNAFSWDIGLLPLD